MTPTFPTDDLRITGVRELAPPEALHRAYPISDRAARTVFETRHAIHRILHGEDDRLVTVIGPCSIHDTEAARVYAGRLAETIAGLDDALVIVMRVYFEKPRTTVGWKGLINDPDLDGSFDINKGLHLARALLLDLNERGVPAGTEFLDLVTGQYFADLVSWGAIGARTTESQVHRELASGLSCPVGFKNGTGGDLTIAVDAVRAARHPHIFLSPTKSGRSAIFSSVGNLDAHVILRGGPAPNYDEATVQKVIDVLAAAELPPRLMIDCSHANSGKRPGRQGEVAEDVARRIAHGDRAVMGVMVESHLVAGRQDVAPGVPLRFGQSITDACIGWEDSLALLNGLADAVRRRRGATQER
jgi:3-deoxy-7-phosphoheptulonate synthase